MRLKFWQKTDPVDKCPDCGGRQWLEGPHGGGSVNIYCASCGAGFNHTGFFGMDRIAAPGPLPTFMQGRSPRKLSEIL